MAWTTSLRNGANSVLRLAGLRLETLTAERWEQSRLTALGHRGHFNKPAFPLLPRTRTQSTPCSIGELPRTAASTTEVDVESVTAILNCYKRTRWFPEQMEAIKRQTHPVSEVLVWKNQADTDPIPQELKDQVAFVECNRNLGVWARFALALNARSEFICVFDDDTIPGDRWIENCVKTYRTNPGLLGTVGVVFGDKNYTWRSLRRVGWCNPNEETQKVDIVGHSWFFHRDMLSVMWREMPPRDQIPIVGEDIHFAHMIQKYTECAVWVPPHPAGDKSLWGSTEGEPYGTSREGISQNRYMVNGAPMSAVMLMGHYLSQAVDGGFKLLEGQS